MAVFRFRSEADTIIAHAEDQIVFAAANFQNYIARPGVFVRIEDRFA